MPAKTNKPQIGDVKEESYFMNKAYKMEGKDKKNFKPHKMYCKNGSVHNAKTYKQHLALKKKGCDHKPIKK
jgi:hypothetical protein|tara:strand:+ start:610 stop:822 length:213 start_codon:yes stop_codon:yes gene_type:complete